MPTPDYMRVLRGVPPASLREDGTLKGQGYFGELDRPGGGYSTELSFDAGPPGQEIFGPLLVPTLTPEEVRALLSSDARPSDEIYGKAIDFAKYRMSQGMSPFAGGDEEPYPYPDFTTAGLRAAKEALGKRRK